MATFNYNILVTGDCQSNSSGSIKLILTGGTAPYGVKWLIPDLGVETTYSSSERLNLSYGTYTVEVNDSTVPQNNSFLINIPISSGLCISILNVINTSCGLDNGAISGSSSSDFSYTIFSLYDNNDTYISSTTSNNGFFYFSNIKSGIYYIIGVDYGGCSGRSETFVIEESVGFDFGIYSVSNSTCDNISNGKIYITGQTGHAPYTYTWSNGSTSQNITGLTEGEYSVVVSDSKGCSKSKSIILDRVNPVGFGFATPYNPTCFNNNGSILFYTTGGTEPFCYSGSNGTVEVSYSREFLMENLSPGNYSIFVRDAALCSYIQYVSLQSPNSIRDVNIKTKNSNCSSSDGEISVSIFGGSFPYTYYIVNPSGNTIYNSTSDTLYVFTGLSSGTYTVGVSDASGCTFSDEVLILAADKFLISANTTSTSCGLNNGSIDVVQLSASTPPYYYYIDGVPYESNNTGYTFTQLSSGSYVIGVGDSTSCIQNKVVTVEDGGALDFSLSYVPCTNGSNGIVNVFITSGKPPFNYNWSNNVSGNPQYICVSGLTGGTYFVTIIDDNGCSLRRDIDLDCNNVYTSYQTYSVYDNPFEISLSNKRGMLELLNEGFEDLTSGNTSCDLVIAKFIAEINITPSAYTDSIIFYVSMSRTDVPYDNLWFEAIKTLLMKVNYIDDCLINPINNTITIISNQNSNGLSGQLIEVNLKILYDIVCLS